MTTTARVAFATIVTLGSWINLVQADEPPLDARTAFAKLKTLEGEWKITHEDGKHGTKELKEVFKVTAAGSTVMETQHQGTGHEMVTMYHLDGKDLLVTHYCAAGNQPRLKLDLKASKPDSYVFVFDGGTNLNPDKDMHIHGLKLNFLENGKVEAEWEGWMDGKKGDTVKFPMSRK